jgi:hypothetical protein
MTLVRDDSDLDSLPPEQRALRLKIRREIQLGLIAHAGQSVADVEHDRWLRQKAAEAEGGRERDTASQQRAWNRAFDQRWDAKWLATLGEEDNDIDAMIVDACGETLALARKETKAALAALKAELRAEMESKLAASEARVEASEARTQKLEAELIELRSQARNSAAKITDDLHRCAADVVKVDKAVASLRIEIAHRVAGLRERIVDAVENRPVFDSAQVDRAIETAVGRTRAEVRAELSVELARSLEAQRREFAVEFQALKERLGDVASRPSFDQGQIEREAATAAETAVAQLRVGLDGVVEAQAHALKARLDDLEARLKSTTDKLPVAKVWVEGSITYETQIVTHNGATFQSVHDTAKTPGVGEDWRCLARAGRDGLNGVDGRSLCVRGVFDLHDSYSAMDVVAYEGGGYIAKRDNPGVPGVDDGWLLIAARGMKGESAEPGKVGQRGQKGDRGPPGAKVDEWRIAREHFCAVPFLSDGTAGAKLNLRELFEEYQNQTT